MQGGLTDSHQRRELVVHVVSPRVCRGSEAILMFLCVADSKLRSVRRTINHDAHRPIPGPCSIHERHARHWPTSCRHWVQIRPTLPHMSPHARVVHVVVVVICSCVIGMGSHRIHIPVVGVLSRSCHCAGRLRVQIRCAEPPAGQGLRARGGEDERLRVEAPPCAVGSTPPPRLLSERGDSGHPLPDARDRGTRFLGWQGFVVLCAMGHVPWATGSRPWAAGRRPLLGLARRHRGADIPHGLAAPARRLRTLRAAPRGPPRGPC